MQAELEEIVKLSLKKALDYDAKGNIGLAYAYYYAVLELSPAKRADLEKRFTTILCEWGIYLEQRNRLKDVVKCYQNSLEIFPRNPVMLNNFAAHLLRNEESLAAIKYLQRALDVDSNFLPAERNMQNAFSMTVNRWHFIMLNDKCRNQAYEQAIKKRIQLGYNTVLDIGTGTGLLSLYADNAGAKKVYACEYSEGMCNIAKEVFYANQTKNIKLICKPSTDLRVPKDIDDRVKLIVTEIFDAALFGELVIPTLIDAHKNLLATDGSGIIIPMNATLYIAAVECEHIRFRSSVFLNKVGSLNFENIIVLPDEEYYDTENLENVDINYITEPKPLIKINFNDLGELENFMKDGVKESLTTTCHYSGCMDGLVAFFKLNLDESITLDSSQRKSCWQSAIFPTYPQKVKCNDKIVIVSKISKGRLKCICKFDHNTDISDQPVYQMPRDIITFFNDKEYVLSLVEASKSNKQKTIRTVFDTSPFPIYGLSILKEHPSSEILYFQTENSALMQFIEHIVKTNNIIGKVIFIRDFNEINGTLDNIYAHNFDTKGEFIDCGQQSFREACRSLLSSCGVLIPEKIFLMAQLVHSEELPKMVSVNDDNLQGFQEFNLTEDKNSTKNNDSDNKLNFTSYEKNMNTNCKYKIAGFINKFKINQVLDLNSSLYNHTTLSDPKILVEIDDTEYNETVINFKKIFTQTKPNISNSLLIWYKIFICDNIVLETKRSNSFMNHSAVLLENELQNKILRGEDVNIKIKQMHDVVKISIE